MSTGSENVVRISTDPDPPETRPTAPTRMHGLAIGGMALCALLGIVSMLALITVNWPGQTGRYVVGTFVLAGVGFLACASAAVLTAARDTYPRSKTDAD